MNIIPTAIEGVVILEPRIFADQRGYFMTSWAHEVFQSVCPTTFVQDNQSHSIAGVVRGLHYQCAPKAQSKLVRCLSGRVLDVAVDIRLGSPTFGQYIAVELSAENARQLFIPRGFAHGFSVLSTEATVLYKCDEYYAPHCERSILWSDPALGIDWGIDPAQAILSDKDALAPTLEQACDLFHYSDKLY